VKHPTRLRAALFDLDGTLLDSLEDLAASMNSVLSRHAWPEHPVDAYRYFVGEGVEELVRRAMPEAQRAPAVVATLLAEMRAEYSGRWAERTRPYPGIPELLDALLERGLKLAVLSNKLDEMTRAIVAQLLPRWRFEVVLGATAGLPRKPDPAPALEVARRLAVAPGEVVYLGDTSTDMETAVGAGMLAVGVLWGFRGADELRAAGARTLLQHPLELLAFLDG